MCNIYHVCYHVRTRFHNNLFSSYWDITNNGQQPHRVKVTGVYAYTVCHIIHHISVWTKVVYWSMDRLTLSSLELHCVAVWLMTFSAHIAFALDILFVYISYKNMSRKLSIIYCMLFHSIDLRQSILFVSAVFSSPGSAEGWPGRRVDCMFVWVMTAVTV